MAVSLKHKFQSAKPNGVDSTLIQPSNWNDEHALTLAGNRLLGRITAGNGDAEEIGLGAGLAFSAGNLIVSGKANSGVNSDITEIQGLTTPLTVLQGGTGATTQGGARTNLGLGALATKTKAATSDLADLTTAKRLIGSPEASVGPTELSLGAGFDVIGSEFRNTYAPWRGQAVNIMPVDSNGFPNYIPGSSGALSLTTFGLSSGSPLVLTANQGIRQRIAVIQSNQTFGSLAANTTNFLYFTLNTDGTVTPGSTTVAPIYQFGGTPSITSGQFTYNIVARTMYLGDGVAANPVYAVFVGEAVTLASSVTSSVSYAANGRYVSVDTGIAGGGTRQAFAHNIGVQALQFEVWLKNQTAQHGYNPGMMVRPMYNPADINMNMGCSEDRNTVAVWYSGTVAIPGRSGGGYTGINVTLWRYVVIADRGWD